MDVYIGCSGWNYKEWRGEFYPQKLAQKNWLEYYAGIFNTVEVNNTFYKLPKDTTLINWKNTAPENFNFTLKGSRYVTQMKKLNDPEESLKKFQDVITAMGDKLSCVLWQLPPNLHRNDEKLTNFCKALSNRNKNVIEFRHDSWFDEEIYEILRKYNITFCSISSPDFPEDMITTGKTGYVRFHGKGKNWYDYDYSDVELREWCEKIRKSDVEEVYIYFNNDIGVNAPRNAQQLMTMFKEDN